LTTRKVFFIEEERIEKMTETFTQRIDEEKIDEAIALTFLIFGMVLQGIALFID
jgi:hypothetical protein